MILRFDELARYRGLVTLVDGSFDPLHSGHLSYFHKARSFGYPLLCNICPDSYTQTKHPILLPAKQRAQVLDSLKLVSYVHVSEVPTEIVIRELQPAIYAKGDGWKGKLPLVQLFACAVNETRVEFTGASEGSSTQLLQAARQQPSDVDAFEQLVFSQREPEKDWAPVLPYTIEARREAEGIQPRLIKEVFQPQNAFDFGCGAGYLVAFLSELGVKIKGYEPSEALREMVPPYVQWLVKSDWWDNEMNGGKPIYDLVICREVLEHCTIRKVHELVHQLCWFSKRFVYITTRFAKQPASLLSVDTSDDLDPTHITMLNKDFLRTLFVLEGFKRRADLEDRMDWKKLGRCLVYERAA